jgi:tetratricopeptide (TPR) repeat protein
MAWMKDISYQKQIVIYLGNRCFRQAYDFSLEYATAYPDDMVAHFLAAKSALKIEKYLEAAMEARKAFNLAKDETDMTMCAIHAGVAYYRLGEFRKGYDLLNATLGLRPCEELEQLMFLFCLALGMDSEVARHLKAMVDLDGDAAGRFVAAVAEGVPIDYDRMLKGVDRFGP